MRDARIVVPLLAAGGLAAVAGGAIVVGSRALDSAVNWALALAVVAAGLLPLARDWQRGKFDLFNLRNAFLGYYVLQFGVWALWILATGETKFIANLDRWQMPLQRALLCALLGVVAFHLGYSRRLGEKLAAYLPHFRGQWRAPRLWLLTLVLVPLALWSFHVIVVGAGSLGDFVAELAANRTHGIREKGYYLLLAWFGPTVLLLATYAWALETRTKKHYALAGGLALLVGGIGFLLGQRAFVIFPLLQMACVHHYLRARLRFRPRYLLAGLALAFVLNIYTVYREVPLERLHARQVAADLQQAEFWQESSVAFLRRFSGIETLALVVERTETHPFGVPSAVTLLTFPIPRSVWAEKTTPIGLLYARSFLYDVAEPEGASPTLPGELYWNFGVAGILGGLFFIGVFCKTAYSYLLRHRDKSALLLYSVALVYVIWMIDAPTTHTAGFLAQLALMSAALTALTLSPLRSRP